VSAPLRLVLAGLGARGRYWRTVIEREPRARAVAFVDPSAEARAAFEALEPGVPTFADLDGAVAAVRPDALVLATPPDTRRAHLELACAERLPVLVEKPLSLDLAEAARFVRMADAAGIPLMVGLNFRYLDVTVQTKRLLREGGVGRAEFARFTYERWRDGHRPGINRYPLTMVHPMLWEQSIHHFDLWRYVYEDEPTDVYARTFNPSWSMYGSDTNVSAIFSFARGRTVNYQGTWQSSHVTPGFEWRSECSEGVVIQRDQFGDLHWARRDVAELTEVALAPHETWVTDTAGVLAAFVAHLQEGAPLECSGADHLRSLAMVEACVRSAATGDAVSVPALLAEVGASAEGPIQGSGNSGGPS
jgi:predicted dehydrogenase